jgi:hypothetical protein
MFLAVLWGIGYIFFSNTQLLHTIILRRKIGERAPYNIYQYMTNHPINNNNDQRATQIRTYPPTAPMA